jgi:alkylation response protein AidB-like acyl-CoA dehydrogenase
VTQLGRTAGISSAADLAELRSSVRGFLAAKSGEQQVRAAIGTQRGYDDDLWRDMAGQLGLASLALPEKYGGDGFGFLELQVVLEELGRALTPSPFFASVVLAAGAVLAAGDEAAAQACLPGIASGQTTAALAVAESAGLWSFDQLATTARPAADGGASDNKGGWLLAGTKQFVLHGATADLLIVAAQTGQGPGFFAVRPGHCDPTLTRTALRTLDLTRPMAAIQFSGTPATLIGAAGSAGPALATVLDLAMTALAAEQAGAARACLEASAGYARERHQFGRPIGSFQAVKHKCADMLVKVELAQAAATEAARAAAGDPDAAPLPQAAAVAHAVCSESLMFVAAENIQVHGGIGFTWEHTAHLYFRRAKASQLMFGGPGFYFEHLLRRSRL